MNDEKQPSPTLPTLLGQLTQDVIDRLQGIQLKSPLAEAAKAMTGDSPIASSAAAKGNAATDGVDSEKRALQETGAAETVTRNVNETRHVTTIQQASNAPLSSLADAAQGLVSPVATAMATNGLGSSQDSPSGMTPAPGTPLSPAIAPQAIGTAPQSLLATPPSPVATQKPSGPDAKNSIAESVKEGLREFAKELSTPVVTTASMGMSAMGAIGSLFNRRTPRPPTDAPMDLPMAPPTDPSGTKTKTEEPFSRRSEWEDEKRGSDKTLTGTLADAVHFAIGNRPGRGNIVEGEGGPAGIAEGGALGGVGGGLAESAGNIIQRSGDVAEGVATDNPLQVALGLAQLTSELETLPKKLQDFGDALTHEQGRLGQPGGEMATSIAKPEYEDLNRHIDFMGMPSEGARDIVEALRRIEEKLDPMIPVVINASNKILAAPPEKAVPGGDRAGDKAGKDGGKRDRKKKKESTPAEDAAASEAFNQFVDSVLNNSAQRGSGRYSPPIKKKH